MAKPTSAGAKPSVAGHIVSAGQASRDALTRMLGVDRLGEPYAVSSVAWLDFALEVALEVGREEPLVLRIEARSPESKGLLLTKHLNLFIRGSEAPEQLVRTVAGQGARHLANWNMERLARLIQADPEAGKPGLPMPPAADESERPTSLLDTWGGQDSYADFFAGGEQSRSQLDSVDFSRLFRFIQHSDAECTQVNPNDGAPTVTLSNFPWDDRLRSPLGQASGDNGPGDDDAGDSILTTDINEEDVIFGNREKLRAVLKHATEHGGPNPKPLFVSNTCVPAVTGEDVESLVKEAQEVSGQRICYLTVSRRSMATVFQELLVDRRKEAEAKAGPPPPKTVNLLGFPSSPAVEELEALLGAAGLAVNMRFMPDISPSHVDRLPNASLHVMLPNRTWSHLFDQVTFESRTPHIAPPSPYGFAGTRLWLDEVAAAMELDAARVEASWSAHVAPWQDRWETLRAQAAGRRLGLVVRDQETYYLTTPGTTWGMPLVALLEEMGFGLDILVHVSDKAVARKNAKAVREMFSVPERHSILAFDSFPFLRHRLRESRCSAVLTYQFFDWRVTEAGKATFSLQHLEMGVPGAVRSLERLLRVSGSSFYHRYGRYLARTGEGLRAPPRAEQPADQGEDNHGQP